MNIWWKKCIILHVNQEIIPVNVLTSSTNIILLHKTIMLTVWNLCINSKNKTIQQLLIIHVHVELTNECLRHRASYVNYCEWRSMIGDVDV